MAVANIHFTSAMPHAPDSRPRLEGARYKYLTSCSRLLSPPYPTVTHTLAYIINRNFSPPRVSAMGLWVQSSDKLTVLADFFRSYFRFPEPLWITVAG